MFSVLASSKPLVVAVVVAVSLASGWLIDHNRLSSKVDTLKTDLSVANQKLVTLEELTAKRKAELAVAQENIVELRKVGKQVVTKVITKEIPADCAKAGKTAIEMLEDFNRRTE